MAYIWCGLFNCFTDDVEDIIGDCDICDHDCQDCEYEEDIEEG